MESNELAANHAWQIGAAIEAGVDTQEARRRIDAGEIVVPAAGMVIGGGFVATATGFVGTSSQAVPIRESDPRAWHDEP